MYIILWIIFGGIAGWVASIITKNNQQMGIVENVVIGLFGAILGGLIASGIYGSRIIVNFSWVGLMFAIVGSVILLLFISIIRGDRKRLT